MKWVLNLHNRRMQGSTHNLINRRWIRLAGCFMTQKNIDNYRSGVKIQH